MYFGYFSLSNSANCSANFLEVRDGEDDNSPLLAKVRSWVTCQVHHHVSPQLCGRSIPSSLHSSGSVLSFRLHTSRGYSGGYDLTYTSSEAGPGCGGEVGGTRGVVTSPGYPGVTNTSSDCWWVVRVPQGQRIQLRSVNDWYIMGLKA